MPVPSRTAGSPFDRPAAGPHPRPGRRTLAALAATALATPLLLTAAASPAAAAPAGAPADSASAATADAEKGDELARKLVRRTGAKGAMKHIKALQAIARHTDGHRAAGSRGHELSAKYAGTLLKAAGYEVTYQSLDFVYRETLAEKMKVTSPEERDVPVKLMTYTKSTPEGGTEAAVAPVPEDEDETSGCTAGDYESGDYDGKIALIKRGGCTFAEKQAAAADAGAVAAIVYNNTEGELNGTLEDPANGRIPTGGVSQEDGEALAKQAASEEVTANVELREFQEERTTPNVIAETPGGDEDHVAMFGAHLDSVSEGPGINDNASGSAGILETALQFARAGGTRSGGDEGNKVRFALWTAEEVGLQGAEHYVSELSEAEREKISLYLNFDMIASPNYGLFVYDGDGSENISDPGPEGSAQIEYVINSFMEGRGYHPRPTAFSGRSDYGPFIEVGIPAGGTFTGAEGVKTEAQVELWGGTAGEWYDPCYHQACDDLSNISMAAFDGNVKTIAHAVGTYAVSTDSLSMPVPEGRPADPETADSGGLHEHGHGHER